jgi:hypothetical protein
VNTTSVGAVTNYTFTNVQTNHTIAASFEEIPPGPVSLDGMVSTVSRANTVGNAVTVTNTTGTGVNRLMLVGVSWNANTVPRTITSVTFTPNGGSTMGLTEVRTQQPGPTAYRYAAIYSLLNPPSGQTGTVTVTFSGSVANGIIAGVANFAGVNQMTPLGTPSGAGTTNTAPGVTLTGLSGDELVFDTVFLGGNPAPALTAGAGQTQRWNTNISNSRGAASTEQATGGSVTMSWTAVSSGPWAIVAVPIKPAVVDTTSPTVTIDQTSGQGDPTSVSPIHFTVVFSETVTNFAGGDVALSGTAGATAAVVTEIAPNNGTTYSVAVSGMTNSGTVIASVVAGMAHDAGNNGNEASTSTDNTVRYDATAPAILTCPTNMTTNAGTNCQAIIPDFTSHVVASDDSGGVTITQSPLAGTLVGLGDTVVTLTASDGAENQATCQATITVVEGYVPDITGQPQSVTNLVGTDAMLIVTATSCSEIGYQWMFGTNALTSETASTLTITNVQTSHAGDYTAVLANNAGYATSMVAVLTVILPVAPTVSAGPEILPNGHFRVEFSGSANVPYTIQSATNVLGVWLPLTNMTADGNGLIEFQDFTMPASPMRFYRAVYP